MSRPDVTFNASWFASGEIFVEEVELANAYLPGCRPASRGDPSLDKADRSIGRSEG
jgi:hypothetical protein